MRMSPAVLVVLSCMLCVSSRAAAGDGAVIFDMEGVVHHPTEFVNDKGQKLPAGTAESVDGKFGRAVKFSFVEGARGGFMVAPVRPTPQWNQADGFSFWVKGDGSSNWGGIELIDRDDFGLRYGYCFPIDSTDWRKIVVPWRDLIPEMAGPLVAAKGGYPPSRFGNFWFGKWFYWREYPAETFAIDQVRLETRIESSHDGVPVHPGLARVRARLQRHEPLTIVTMGDSLSDEHHWSNREVLWSKLLAGQIKSKYGSEVTLVNPAIGGTTLTQNLILMPRWLKDHPSPDLVIVWFGYNDWDGGVRGERFGQYLRLAVDRIRRLTKGSADVLLMTTTCSFDRWDAMKELEQAAKQVAGEKKTGLLDITSEFRKAGSHAEALRREYWAWDKTHLGKAGHRLVSQAVLRAIEANASADPQLDPTR